MLERLCLGQDEAEGWWLLRCHHKESGVPAACSVLGPQEAASRPGCRWEGEAGMADPSSVRAVVRGYTHSLRAQSDVPGPGPSGTMDEK